MQKYANLILWVYIVLLFLGGLMGFLKAKSKVSLYTATAFAVVLILCNLKILFQPVAADVVLVVLLVFFTYRLTTSKKFMPNGLMAVLTIVALALRRL